MLIRMFSLLFVLMASACASDRAHTPTGPVEISGAYIFGDVRERGVAFYFNEADRDRAWVVYQGQGLVDCSSTEHYCFYGPRHIRLVLPRRCEELRAGAWVYETMVTRVVGHDPATGDSILMTDGAIQAMFQYNRAHGVVGIYLDLSFDRVFAGEINDDMLRHARDIGTYLPLTSGEPFLRCE